jgi:hypothetical protein
MLTLAYIIAWLVLMAVVARLALRDCDEADRRERLLDELNEWADQRLRTTRY